MIKPAVNMSILLWCRNRKRVDVLKGVALVHHVNDPRSTNDVRELKHDFYGKRQTVDSCVLQRIYCWHIIYPLMIFKVVVITVIMIIWQEKNSSAQFSWKYVELGCGCGLDVSKGASLMLRSNRNFNIPPPGQTPAFLTVSCTCTRVVGNGNDNATNQWFASLNEEK